MVNGPKLTPAQVAVLKQCMSLRTTSTKPIADAMHLATKTVSTHMEAICRAYGTSSRVTALLMAIETGIVGSSVQVAGNNDQSSEDSS